MQISEITIHNFRSIEYSKISLGDYSLMVGANNSRLPHLNRCKPPKHWIFDFF
jgi:hypothetical protein